MRTFLTKTVTIKRLSYVGDKSTFSSVGTAKCYLRPLSETQATANGFQFGQAFALLVEVDIDIRETDTVEIDSQEYTVVGVATHNRLSDNVAHKRVLLTKGEKS